MDPLWEKWPEMISDAHWPFFHFSHSGSNPPPPVRPTLHTRMVGRTDIQTDGDYTKRVVTPFGTTRLKSGIKAWTDARDAASDHVT